MKIRFYLALLGIVVGLAFGAAAASADCGTGGADDKKEKSCCSTDGKGCCKDKKECTEEKKECTDDKKKCAEGSTKESCKEEKKKEG